MEAELAVAALRLQMCPTVHLCIGLSTATIINRTRGGLTGTRVAGSLGRVPVESAFAEACGHRRWANLGFDCGSCRLRLASYIDNIFSVSSTLYGAIQMLEDIEGILQNEWGLAIKPSSRSALVALGSDDLSPMPQKSIS